MPTLWSQTLIPTLRDTPGDAEVPSHQLMLRAGYIRKLGSGSYTYLPLGLRSLRRVMDIIRDEMAAAGAAELFMPTLQPVALWERTQRREAYGENLFVVRDRHGREQALGPTHEEVVTELIGQSIRSYRDLPKAVYQIQTKFRDEFRPRFGVLRSREFLMKDAYSFHATLEGGPGSGSLEEMYERMYAAYERIFQRCGVPYRIVEAEAGPIGGNASHEFMVPSPTGEDVIFSNGSGYAANVEKAEIGPRPSDLLAEPTGELEVVQTPGAQIVADVVSYFKRELRSKLKAESLLKTLVFRVTQATADLRSGSGGVRWLLVVVRGDHEANEGKVAAAAERLVPGVVSLADERDARDAGFAIGYVGPHAAASRTGAGSADDVLVLVDPDAAAGGFWVAGGNAPETHVRHFNWKRELAEADRDRQARRDLRLVHVADVRNASDGDPAPADRGGGTLHATRGIEVGHIFKLGTKYTQALGVSVLNAQNESETPLMGCYGIGVNRILAAAIEAAEEERRGHDEQGIVWPAPIAPFDVLLTLIAPEPGGEVMRHAVALAEALEADGLEVLIDDRDERPGVKFKDADLIGIPARVTLGGRSLAAGELEFKLRDGSNGPKGEALPIEGAAGAILQKLGR